MAKNKATEAFTFSDLPEFQDIKRRLVNPSAPIILDGISDAHVDIYYPAIYALRDGESGLYDSSGQLVATLAGARAQGYSYILSILSATNVSITAHRTDAAEPYCEINAPRRDLPNPTVLA